jgi:predicted ATPase
LSDLKFVSWKEILLKTLDETDPEKLARLLPEVELATFKRRQELDVSPWNSEERSTMSVASEALRVVKRRIMKPGVPASSAGKGARFADSVRRAGTG